MTAIHGEYLNKSPESRFEITRDVLEMWGFFNYDEHVTENEITTKLEKYILQTNAEQSGYPSIDFVKKKDVWTKEKRTEWQFFYQLDIQLVHK